jgi:hypothetical protein
MQVWRVEHPPKRGSYLLGTCPMIHTGFWQTYRASHERVMARLAAIMAAGGSGGGQPAGAGEGERQWKLYFTGHRCGAVGQRGVLLSRPCTPTQPLGGTAAAARWRACAGGGGDCTISPPPHLRARVVLSGAS